MKNTKLTRIFALALALLLCLSLLPMAAFAADEEAGGQEQVQEPQEQPQEQPQETQDDPPAEGAKDAPAEPAKDTPAEPVKDAPAEAAKDTPAETGKDAPAEAAKDTAETGKDAPAKTTVLAANADKTYQADAGETQQIEVGHEHTYGDVVTDTEPSCTEAGTGHKDCVDGDDTRTVTIPALGHDWANADGYCTRCHESHTHSYDDDGLCTECGFPYPFSFVSLNYTKDVGMPQTSVTWSNLPNTPVFLYATKPNATADEMIDLTPDNCSISDGYLSLKAAFENGMADGTYYLFCVYVGVDGALKTTNIATFTVSTPAKISLNISVTGPGRVLDADTNEAVSGAYSVNVGKQQAFLAVPNENCELSRLVINGVASDPDAVRSNGNLFSVIVRDESMDGATITAEFEKQSCTISFDANGGNGTMDSMTVPVGEAVKLPKNTFTRENYVFKSWNSNPRGSGNITADEATVTPEGDLIFYASWVEEGVLRGTVTLGEKKILDQPVTATVRVENASNSERVLSYQWMRGSEKIAGATKASYTLTDDDAGKEISVVVTSSTEAGELRSESFTPAARPAAPTGVTVAQHIVNGNKTALGGHPGRITGLNTTMQYSVNQTSWLNVAGTAFSYSTPRVFYFRYKATDTAPASEVAAVELKDYSTEVKPQASTEKNVYKYDVTLTETDTEGPEKTSTAPEDVGFLIPYPDGVKKNSHQLTLIHDPDGASVSFTQEDAGILAKSKNFSGYTLTAGDANPLSGTVTLDGDPYVGQTLKANTDKTNNTGTLSYQWTRDGKEIEGATADSYTLTAEDQGKKIACIVASSVQTGSVTSEEVTVKARALEKLADVLNDGDSSQGGHPGRIVGVDDTMEYSTDGKTWTAVTGDELLVNAGGTYTFRDKATQKTISSVEVKAYHEVIVRIKNPTYGKVKVYDGTEVSDGDTFIVEEGDTITFSFTPNSTRITVYDLTLNGKRAANSMNVVVGTGRKTLQLKNVSSSAPYESRNEVSVTFISAGEVLRGTVTLGEKKILDQPVTATVKVENASNSERVLSYQWMRGSEKIEGATKGSYILTDEDAGKEIVCVVTSSTEEGELRSEAFIPAARPAAPTSAQVAQHIVNGNKTALGGHPGRITGLNTTMQYSVNQTSWLNVAGTMFSYPTPRVFYFRYKATDTAPASEVAAVELKDYSTEVKPQASTEKNVYKYDVTLTETGAEGAKQVSTAPEDVGFLIPYPDGVKKNSHQLTLIHDPDGASVSFTQEDAGILAKSKNFSGYTLTAGDANPLSGTVTLDGDPYVGQTLKANTDKTNNTGTLSYQWTRDGKEIEGATADSYKLSPEDQGKKIACVVTSSVQTGSVTSEEVTVQEQKIEAVVDVLNDGDTSQGGHPGRIVGVNETMEYSTDGKTWKPVTSSPMLVNEGGTYTFRDKATQKTISSVEVKAYHGVIVRIKNPTYGKVKVYDGTEVSDGDMFIVEEGDTITFSFTPNSTRYAVSSLTLNGKQAANSANVVVGAGKKTLQLKNVNSNAPYESRNLVVVTFASSSSSPRTGDSSNLGLWSALGVTSLAALAVIFVMTKKRRDSEA